MAENQDQPKKPLSEADIKEEAPSKGQKNAVKIVLIVVGVLILLGIIGTLLFGWLAARIGTSIFEQATNGTIDYDNDSVTIGSQDGDFEVTTEQELPADFPEEVPLYEPATLSSSSRVRQGDEIIWTVSYETTDSFDQVNQYYLEILDQGDWSTQSSFESNGMSTIGAANDSAGLFMQLSVNDDQVADGTGITFAVTKQPE